MNRDRVLVVDDEPQILRFLKPSLTAAGYEVITAATGAEASGICSAATVFNGPSGFASSAFTC